MKSKVLLLVSSIILSTTAFAQKEELKTLKKIYAREKTSDSDMAEFKANLTKAESLVANSTEDDKVYFAFYKGVYPIIELTSALLDPTKNTDPLLTSKILSVEKVNQFVAIANATKEYEKKIGKEVYTKNINNKINFLKPVFVNYAVALSNVLNFKDASSILAAIYYLDNTDLEKLYYAAIYAVNSKEYDLALSYYQLLLDKNYTGEGEAFFALNKSTKKEEGFNSKAERELFIKAGTHEKPRDEKILSKRTDILKSITSLCVELGKIDEAKATYKIAISESPNDVELVISCSEFYFSQKDIIMSKDIVLESLEKTPNNADLLFQLGVIFYKTNQPLESKNSFLKVVEINPNYANVNFYLALIILDNEKSINAKISKLTTSPSDEKKYTVLKKQLEEIYKNAIPYLKKENESNPENQGVLTTLINIYGALDMFDEAKVLKAQLKK